MRSKFRSQLHEAMGPTTSVVIISYLHTYTCKIHTYMEPHVVPQHARPARSLRVAIEYVHMYLIKICKHKNPTHASACAASHCAFLWFRLYKHQLRRGKWFLASASCDVMSCRPALQICMYVDRKKKKNPTRRGLCLTPCLALPCTHTRVRCY